MASLSFIEIPTEAPTTTTQQTTTKAGKDLSDLFIFCCLKIRKHVFFFSKVKLILFCLKNFDHIFNNLFQVGLMRSPTPITVSSHQHNQTRNSLRSGIFSSANCDVEFSGDKTRQGSHSTKNRLAGYSCKLTLFGREYDTVHANIAAYKLRLV